MNIQHRVDCDLFPQDYKNQYFNKIEYLIDSFFFDELLEVFKDHMKQKCILYEMSRDIKSSMKKSIKWNEYC